MRRPVQAELFKTRGGKRPGAGRRVEPGGRAGVSHKARERFAKPTPVHATVRIARGVWNLRARRCRSLIEGALSALRQREGFRVIEFSIQGNHVHLVVEADNSVALSRGMQSLSIRVARALNRLMERTGKVFEDHFHSRTLNNPSEVANAIGYLLTNQEHHFGNTGLDSCSSFALDAARRAELLPGPVTWVLRGGWRKAKGLEKRPWLQLLGRNEAAPWPHLSASQATR